VRLLRRPNEVDAIPIRQADVCEEQIDRSTLQRLVGLGDLPGLDNAIADPGEGPGREVLDRFVVFRDQHAMPVVEDALRNEGQVLRALRDGTGQQQDDLFPVRVGAEHLPGQPEGVTIQGRMEPDRHRRAISAAPLATDSHPTQGQIHDLACTAAVRGLDDSGKHGRAARVPPPLRWMVPGQLGHPGRRSVQAVPELRHQEGSIQRLGVQRLQFRRLVLGSGSVAVDRHHRQACVCRPQSGDNLQPQRIPKRQTDHGHLQRVEGGQLSRFSAGSRDRGTVLPALEQVGSDRSPLFLLGERHQGADRAVLR